MNSYSELQLQRKEALLHDVICIRLE